MNRQNRFFHGMIASAALLVTGWLLGGANQRVVPAPRPEDARQADQLLRARRIEIVDQTGAVLLSLAGDEQGGTFTVRDRLGRAAMLAGATSDGGSLQLLNTQTGQPAVQSKVTADGGEWTMNSARGRVGFRAATSNGVATLALHADGAADPTVLLDSTDARTGRIRTFRPDGALAMQIAHDTALGGMIETWSAEGRKLVSLSSTAGAHGRIDTWGPTSDNPLVSIAANGEHEGLLYTYSADGRILAGIATRPVGPALRLYNQYGEPVIALQCTDDGNAELGILKRDGTGRFITP